MTGIFSNLGPIISNFTRGVMPEVSHAIESTCQAVSGASQSLQQALSQLRVSMYREIHLDRERNLDLDNIISQDRNRSGPPYGPRINDSSTNSIYPRGQQIREALLRIHTMNRSQQDKNRLIESLMDSVLSISTQNSSICRCMSQTSRAYIDMPAWTNFANRGARNENISTIEGNILFMRSLFSRRNSQVVELDHTLRCINSNNPRFLEEGCSRLLGT